jgi:ABC-type transport system involved in multi-copper enzyme maturation permease subunit
VSRALAAEWTKLRSLPSSAWLVSAAVAGTVAAGAAWSASVDAARCPAAGCALDLPRLTLAGVWLGQVALAVLGVLAITGEFDTGMVRASLTAVPGRARVLAAKAAVVVAAALAAGTLAVAGSLLAGRAVLAGNGFTAAAGHPPPSPADGPTLRAAAGTVLYLGLVALLGLGVGTVVRDSAAAVTAVLTLLYGFPAAAGLVADPAWRERLQQVAPMPAGLAVQATRDLDQLPIAPWPGLGVLGAWAGAALLAGTVLFARRDIGS